MARHHLESLFEMVRASIKADEEAGHHSAEAEGRADEGKTGS